MKVLIAEMKAELAELKRQKAEGDGFSARARKGYEERPEESEKGERK